jgi:hypothetical protein
LESVLLAQVDDQVWRSADGGAGWQLAMDATGITALTVDRAGMLHLGLEDGSIQAHKLG